MKRETLTKLQAARVSKQPAVLLTDLQTGEQRLYLSSELGSDPSSEAALRGLTTDRAETLELGGRSIFVQPFNPPLRLFVVGAVHIAQALVRMAQAADFEVTVVDPREAFAHPDRFAGVSIRHDWPDEAMEDADLDPRSAVVTLTHDPKLDDAALQVALRKPCFYVGSLGSKKTHAARRHRLSKLGFDDTTLDRIHGPVGLPLGARSPAEIAVSILAQIVEVLRRQPE